MKVSYAITVSDEIKEFTRLMDSLLSWKDKDDEIVVLVDEGKGHSEDIEVYEEAVYYYDVFEGDFAAWKNKLNSYCTGDWIFQIDADEVPSESLIKNLHQILDSTTAECIAVPRRNIVEGITEEDFLKWHWNVSERGINWPDYQGRLYKNIPDRINWKGKVHEKPVGFKRYAFIPNDQDIYRLDHIKTVEKQRQQNAYYETIQR